MEDGTNLNITIYYKEDLGNPVRIAKLNYNSRTYNWNTERVQDGTYTIYVYAFDGHGKMGYDKTDKFFINNSDPPEENHEPEKPSTPSGITNGFINIEYSYLL